MSDAPPSRVRERAVRALALLALYMLDARGEKDEAEIRAWILAARSLSLGESGVDSSGVSRGADARWGEISRAVAALSPDDRERAMASALAAHRNRRASDGAAARHAPQWPAARQPAMDRSVLRLALWELSVGRADARIVINEAVELAKRYCGERSSGFINAILDREARSARLLAEDVAAPAEPAAAPLEDQP